MSFIICHCRKIGVSQKVKGKKSKNLGLSAVAWHNDRSRYDERIETIEPSKTKQNEGWRAPGLDIEDAWSRKAEGLKVRKGSAKAVEIIFTASPEFFSGESAAVKKQFFADGLEFFKKRFGAENLLQWNIHRDETTEHMHLLFEPIVRKDGERLYRASEFINGPKAMADLQTELANAVGIKYGLVRGAVGSEARHDDAREWKKKLKKQEAELQKREQEIKEREEKIEEREQKALDIVENAQMVGYGYATLKGEDLLTWDDMWGMSVRADAPRYEKQVKTALRQYRQSIRLGQ